MGYLSILLEEGKKFVGKCPELPWGSTELDILVQLQHFGAATGLIDFTTDPYVALWFACAEHSDKDGAVYILSRDHTNEAEEKDIRANGILNYFYRADERNLEGRLSHWAPISQYGARPDAQQSVLVFGTALIVPALLKRVIVKGQAKEDILDELRLHHNISADSLFPDFVGHAQNNAASKPFDVYRTLDPWQSNLATRTNEQERARAHFDLALAHAALGEYKKAEEQLTIGLRISPEDWVAYANRAKAKWHSGNLDGAVEDYDSALRFCPEESQRGRLLWERGSLREKLGQTERGIEDMNLALKLRHTVYVHRGTDQQETKLRDYPPQLDEFQVLE